MNLIKNSIILFVPLLVAGYLKDNLQPSWWVILLVYPFLIFEYYLNYKRGCN